MIERSISATIRKSAAQVPVVTLLGPRQAGKTALVRELFPEYTYVNLEDRSARELAENDYLGFFSRYPEPEAASQPTVTAVPHPKITSMAVPRNSATIFLIILLLLSLK